MWFRSRQKCSCLVFLLFGSLAGVAPAVQGQSKDESVLKYYWDRARAVFFSGDPIQHGAQFSYDATSYYKSIGKQGGATLVDSLKVTRYHSFGNLDSSVAHVTPHEEILTGDITVPFAFDSAYLLNFFPNDTGGPEIALGFDTDSSRTELPVGLVIVNRQQYIPKWLYLTYRHAEGYRYLSRAYRFAQVDGYIFPDSMWEIGVINRIFSNKSYRIETGITNIKVYR